MNFLPPDLYAPWTALQARANTAQTLSLKKLFDDNVDRFSQFSAQGAGLLLDYSKNLIDTDTLNALLALAQAAQVECKRDAMFAGAAINQSENRAVLHTALRAPLNPPVFLNGENLSSAIHEVLSRMASFAEKIRSGAWQGYSGLPITDIVNIGIGGSDLGPQMVCAALENFAHPRLKMHFVSNVDGHDLSSVLKRIQPAQTLFVIASKTFTTEETLANAHSARDWFLANGGQQVEKHFVAVSTNAEQVQKFGIALEQMFEFWDWVGGRYSLWSAIGLPIMLSVGASAFFELLAGAHAMDQHFREAPLNKNLPVLLGLVEIWGRNFLHYSSRSIAPYHYGLRRFPAYLQQLEMESNGKSVQRDGQPTFCATSAVLWGEPGTNGQHAYFQMLHQGTDIIPTDFIAVTNASHALPDQHTKLLANCLAQSQALAFGANNLESYRQFSGNRPSNTLVLDELNPHALGALIALYEHKTFVCGAVWNINSFDQWGVELGKKLAKKLESKLQQAAQAEDSSTTGLIHYLQRHRKNS